MYHSNRRGHSHKRSKKQKFSAGFSSNNKPRKHSQRSRHKAPKFDPSKLVAQVKNQQQDFKPSSVEVYQPKHQFSDFNIDQKLKKNIASRGYQTPTPIQDQIIPHILEGRDAVGIANTGTGKTAAFLIPLLNKVLKDSSQKVLIITPTRELALQIRDELRHFTYEMRIFSTLCIGGANIARQIESLKRGQHFVIGTPGRIKDLNQRGKLKFEQFTNIVLDEVDRMLDMGFVHEIRAIIDRLPVDRQSLFFSATMNDRVRGIMNGFLHNPVSISVKTKDTTDNVKQEIVKVDGKSKVEVLHDLLISDGFDKVLVFGRTKRGTENLSRKLRDRGFSVNAIHGNKSQGQRQRALREFRKDKIQVLIATDVIARGLDIDNVTHVINYDLPESYEDYIHRIGRTGRADKMGTAISFVG